MKKICKIVGIVLLILLVAASLLLGYLQIMEYKPKDEEEVQVSGEGSKTIQEGETVKVLTYNIGYGALDKSHDFFMDGGSDVNADSRQQVLQNMQGISSKVYEVNADVTFLQETDKDSNRSYHIDESAYMQAAFPGTSAAYATNFRCAFIPYPLPPIGKVESGLTTLNQFSVTEASRISLESSFSWPIRLAQMKRCLLVERVPLENSDKELVLVNLHLEAYDSDGEGKKAQTEQLFSFLQEEYEKGNYCIAGGDFNQMFDNIGLEEYPIKDSEYSYQPGNIDTQDMAEKGWTFANDASTPTCRLLNQPYKPVSEDTQYYVVDGFITSPNISVESTETLDCSFTYSDHNPVLLTAVLSDSQEEEDKDTDTEKQNQDKSKDTKKDKKTKED